jgi:hypothetical protein
VAFSYRQLRCTPSILILVLSVVLLIPCTLLYSYSCQLRNLTLLYFLGTDYAAQKTHPLYSCRGVLPRSCLANNLSADHIENIFLCSRIVRVACLLVRYVAMNVLYCLVFLYAITSNGCLPRICLRGNVFIEPLPSTGSIRHILIS